MQTVNISNELSSAINTVESLLNSNDGEFVLESIRKYKTSRDLDPHTLRELRLLLYK